MLDVVAKHRAADVAPHEMGDKLRLIERVRKRNGQVVIGVGISRQAAAVLPVFVVLQATAALCLIWHHAG